MDILIFSFRSLLAALLYVFLGAILILLWRDLRAAPPSYTAVQERKAKLVVLEAEAGLEPDAVFWLQPFTTLGRSAANTIILPDTFTSAEHALVCWRGGQWWLEDLGSRNGTRLNDAGVTTPTVLSAGDVIGIGQVRLRVEIDA